VTFLITDVEGSTRLWDQHRDEMRAALEAHDAIIRGAVAREGGYVFATGGDGFCVAFQRASAALNAVLTARQALDDHSWPEGAELKVRMSLHTGEAVERDGDYYGTAVNRAARLVSAARGAQVLVSAATAALLGDELPSGAKLVDLGSHALRGLERAEHLFQLCPQGVVEVLLPATRDAIGNLPTSATSFVGQSVEVKRLVADLSRRRLITLTGVGGVGKTRLALEVAWVAHDEFADGAWLVELAPLAEAEAVVQAVALVLRVEPRPGLALEDAVAEALADRAVLLVIDNCEHVIDSASHLIDRLVSSCRSVTVLATSREPLGVAGERVVGVRSLDPALEAVELFCDRAEAADSDFSPSAADLEIIERICARLDGIPLAVELAAARSRTMSLSELERRLSDPFRLLRGSGRGRVARHQTLRATLAWSYLLLSEPERAVFERCAVFAGTFDKGAARFVCAGDAVEANEIEDLVTALVDKHMIEVDRRGADTRYKLLETLRQYAEEQLGSDLPMFRARHLAHYVAVAGDLDRLFQGSDLGGGNAGFHLELDNLRAAMQWAIATRDPVTVSLMRATMTFSQVASVPEIGGWFVQILDALDDPPVYAYGVAAITSWTFDTDTERAGALAQTGIDKAASPDDPELANCLCTLAMVTLVTSAPDSRRDVVDLLQRAIPLYRAAGNPVHAVMMMQVLSDITDGLTAQDWARAARDMASGLNSQLADIVAAIAEGTALSKRGDAASALATLRLAYDQIVAADVRGNVKSALLSTLVVALADGPATSSDDAFVASSLRRLQSDGHKGAIPHGLWTLVIYLAATSRLEPAAVVLGFLEHAGVQPLDVGAGQRADDAIAAQPQNLEWRARGRRLSQDEAFAVAMAAFEDNDQQPD
jgi:predicted ATPase/class 3 adenylate cyclase